MSRGTILFVDDEENILNSLRRGLIDEDYECLFALNGKDALEIIKNNAISVIVTDMRMPGMDGLTLLKEAKQISPNSVRIVLSGYTQLQQILATINQVDIFKFITKPWKLEEEFKVVIDQALEYYNLRMESENLKKALESRNVAYQNMIKNIEDKIAAAKYESNIIKDTSKAIFEHLFKSIDNNINDNKNDFNYEFERSFWEFYNENISSEIEELNAANLFDNMILALTGNNKQFKVVNDFKFPDDYKIKTNKVIFDLFIRHILISSINSNDSYMMKINGDIKYILDKEIIEFVFSLCDLTNEKTILNSSFCYLNQERIDFINTFMNEYFKFCNGKFELKQVGNKLLFKIQLIKILK